MKKTKKAAALLLGLLTMTSCGMLRPADADTAETDTAARMEESALQNADAAEQTAATSSGGLTFDAILADYEAKRNAADEEEQASPASIPAPQVSADTAAASDRPEVSYSKYDLEDSIPADAVRVTLDGTAAEFDGSGLSLQEGVLTIEGEGVYLLTGSFSGQIRVDAGPDAHVRLIFAGVSLSGPMAPLFIVNADKVVLTLAAGTENTVSDTSAYVFADGEDEPDAAVFSKEDLTINGTGSLTVTGNYRDGIVSKDDLKIVSGTVRVSAVHNGIKGKDSLTVRDGVIDVTAGNDAIKASNDSDETRGWVIFEGGDTTVSAGDDAIHAETWLLVYGGTVDIRKSYEGLEAMKIEVYGGDVSVVSSDDAINAASGSSGDALGFGGGNFGGFGGQRGGASAPDENTAPPDGNFGGTIPGNGGMTPPNGDMTPPDESFGGTAPGNGGMTPPNGDMTPPDGNFGGTVPGNGDMTPPGGDMTPPDGNFGGHWGGVPTPSTSGENTEGTDTLFGGRGGGRGNGGGGFGGGMQNEQPEDGVWILIAGGTIRTQGGNDILDTNGTFTQTGGTVIAVGPNMSIYGEPDGILDTNGSAAIEGGTFAAFCRSTGSGFAGILSSPAVACTSLNGAETVTLADAEGNPLVSFANGTRAQNVVITSDRMTAGEEYLLILDGRTAAFTAEDGVQTVR